MRLLVLLVCSLPVAAQSPEALLARMSVADRFWQLFMIPGDRSDSTHDYSRGIFGLQVPAAPTARADAARLNALQRYFVDSTRLGIPIIPFEEAVHGLRRPGATMFPAAIALAATFDTALMGRAALAIARETRSRGIRQVLSPVVNVATDVRWGRVEETYGEDPWLASAMARAFVAPFERLGVVTTPKHFVANVGDGGRDSYPIALDARALAEVHFPPFRAALDAGARSVMTAYNSVGGLPATQNPHLLNGTLRDAWNFDGFVISDAAATGGATVLHLTEPDTPTAAAHAFAAGLDVVFQSTWPQHRPYLAAVADGLVPDAVRDTAVLRVLRVKEDLGLFTNPWVSPDSAAHWNGHADHLALAREAAAAGMVLLRNDGVLPLMGDETVALLGIDATEGRLGGYSSDGVAPVTMLDGLRERLGDRVRYASGPGRDSATVRAVPRTHVVATAEFIDGLAFTGPAAFTRIDSGIDAHWTFAGPSRALGTDFWAVRWTGALTAGADLVTRLGVQGTDGWRLWLDGQVVAERWEKRSAGTTVADVRLEPGSRHDLRLEYRHTVGNARVRLVWDAGGARDMDALLADAVDLAARSDVAVIVAGIEEGEFRDRALLGLPGRQEDLIEAVAATGVRVIVVLVGGSAITMPWLERVDAVLMAWYPGEQGGHALADVLLGAVNPSGRLPITFPVSEGQLPLVYNHWPTGRGDDYVDLTGEPLFPFGHGLSYSSFDYGNLDVTRDTVRFTVRNSGRRAGHEVAQLYVRDQLASVARPVLQLAGASRVFLRPGESRTVAIPIPASALTVLDVNLRPVVEPGTFAVFVGRSSRDVRLRGTLSIP